MRKNHGTYIVNILFLSRSFYPETNASASRVFERACHWIQWGHKVTIITCCPSFEGGKIYDNYKNRWYCKEIINGIKIIRVKTVIPKYKTFFLKIVDNIVFMVMSFFLGLFENKPDVVCVSSPQFFSALSGWSLSFLKRVPFVFEVADLWPESVIANDSLKENALLARLTQRLAIFLYRRSNKIVSLTHSIAKRIENLGIDKKKIKTIINGVNLEKYSPMEKDKSLLKKLNIEGKLVLGYLGGLRVEQDLAVILDSAKLILEREKESDIVFIFVGEGHQKQKLMEIAANEKLSNVVFIPPQPKNEINKFWSICDIALIPLKNVPLFSGALPSKMFEAMGMGLPILLISPEGEASEIVLRENVGTWVKAGEGQSLANEVLKLFNDKKRIKTYAENSYIASSHYTRKRQAKEMLDVFKEFERQPNK